MSRCSFEKPSSLDRFLRTRSPSSSVIGRPPSSNSFERSTLAIVLLPEPDEAREKHGKPLPRTGRVATPQLLHHFGIRKPTGDVGAARNRSRSSVPLMSSVFLPCGTSSTG